MESSSVKPNPFLSFLHHHCNRFASDLSSRFEDTKRLAEALATRRFSPLSPPFASVSQSSKPSSGASTTILNPSHVAKALAGTSVFTVSNTNNEFVLISDPTGDKSIGLLCFRQEDAEAFLAQVLLFSSLSSFLLSTRSSPPQLSELLVVRKKNKRYCPVYFSKEDIESELSKYTRASRGEQQIMVGSLEDVLRKMERSEKNSGWEDVIFIPPGRSYAQHMQESELLVVRKKNKRYCPVYFSKEDIERELSKYTRASRGEQQIMVRSLEDVVRKMERSEKNSGWEDVIFIPPGRSYAQHMQEVAGGLSRGEPTDETHETRKIPVDVLINMWTEMHDLDEEVAFATLVDLSHKNLLTLEEDPRLGSLYASYYDVFVTHHDVLPETWQFIWEMGDMHWSNFDMDFPKAEILILNFSSDKYVLPPFLSKMIRLRFLVIINNGMSPAVLHNLSVFANLSKLKSLWLERVHVPELYNTTIPMKHLHKMSLILCKINNSFDQTGVDVSSIFPKLRDLTIDHCDDLLTLPSSICRMTSLNSLSMTNCPRLTELPKTLSKLQALELLRLHACHELKALPVEICELLQLKYLDISQCVSLICLPEDIGKLKMLEKIDMRECYISSKVRSAVSLESLRHVNCDKDVAFIWEDVEKAVPGLRIESC
ncbi:hypothetical protein F2Q68_00028948 [Brassica cretica]|uniref:Uncharacterized protein n=1 Tax=Brassica cretica TaxID=69181 RepID=A0A8S9G878_BRACR|nr:hypothetical protein F2Q68_00028948 [Brassica cretica]